MKELLYLKDDQLKDLIEKLFIGYRETFSDSKKILEKYSIGVAHQKVIHFLSMYEGITISELLKKLKITKQSLNRVLKDLIKIEMIIFEKDDQDTRVKHVYLNDKGKKISNEIFDTQKKHFRKVHITQTASSSLLPNMKREGWERSDGVLGISPGSPGEKTVGISDFVSFDSGTVVL